MNPNLINLWKQEQKGFYNLAVVIQRIWGQGRSQEITCCSFSEVGFSSCQVKRKVLPPWKLVKGINDVCTGDFFAFLYQVIKRH